MKQFISGVFGAALGVVLAVAVTVGIPLYKESQKAPDDKPHSLVVFVMMEGYKAPQLINYPFKNLAECGVAYKKEAADLTKFVQANMEQVILVGLRCVPHTEFKRPNE